MKELPEDRAHAAPFPIQVFDPREEYAVAERRLPHWSQPGTIAFITWRAWDSMPAKVVAAWIGERDAWLRQHGIDSSRADWQSRLPALPDDSARKFKRYVADRWNAHLDALHGQCVLRRAELARIVAESLCHFHGIRYLLTDYVVMPNHVHLLAAFADEEGMLGQCESWKHYTAREINRVLKRKGRFWQQDGFDHLVRSPADFGRFRRYIADNPVLAGLQSGEFVHESKVLP